MLRILYHSSIDYSSYSSEMVSTYIHVSYVITVYHLGEARHCFLRAVPAVYTRHLKAFLYNLSIFTQPHNDMDGGPNKTHKADKKKELSDGDHAGLFTSQMHFTCMFPR